MPPLLIKNSIAEFQRKAPDFIFRGFYMAVWRLPRSYHNPLFIVSCHILLIVIILSLVTQKSQIKTESPDFVAFWVMQS